MNTEDRKLYYAMAEEWELDFVAKYGEKYGVIINPSKSTDKTAPDLYILKTSVSADLKHLAKPFYKAKDNFGIDAQYCWTLNPSDIFEYSVKYSDNFGIFIWKLFTDSFEYGVQIKDDISVYYTSLFELKHIVMKDGKIHHYIRRMNDTNGNSYGSYGIDLRRLHKIG